MNTVGTHTEYRRNAYSYRRNAYGIPSERIFITVGTHIKNQKKYA